MGQCFSVANPRSKNQRTLTAVEVKQKEKSFDKTFQHNPQLSKETPNNYPPNHNENSASSTVDQSSSIKNIISLEEAIQKSKIDIDHDQELQDLQSWIVALNTKASIVRLPKSRTNGAKNKEQLAKIQRADIQQEQSLDGDMQSDQHDSKIFLQGDSVNIEFIQSRSRAGPLFVPYISQDDYHIYGKQK